MPKNRKKGLRPRRIIVIAVLAVIGIALGLMFFLNGKNVALFNPKGVIAQQQHDLMIYTVTILLAIAVPTVLFAYFIAWKYRESKSKAVLPPKASHNKIALLFIWVLPTAIIAVLVSSMLPATQKLAPQKSIASDKEPLTIQVISLRWKWLFLYPEQNIATVNFAQIPVNTPVRFEMTADETPMSSFWIPNLGGQLYTMTSHVNRLNLMAEIPGDYPGSSAELNGAGFAGMKFTARASSSEQFDDWVSEVKKSPDYLDTSMYSELLKPSENNPTTFYSEFDNDIYGKVIAKYLGSSEGHGHKE